MATKRKGLGRGLDALLSTGSAATDRAETGTSTDAAATSLPVEELRRGRFQPRSDMREESLAELAESIRAQGLIQPIVVRRLTVATAGEPGHEIVAGERRWRAAQMAGLAEVPVVVRDVDDETAMAMALIENIQREDLNPLEEATALQRLVTEFELTHQEAAAAVGRSRAAVSNLLRLTELQPDVQALVRARRLDMGHARALLGISEPRQQLELAERVAAGGLSVRQTEKLATARKTPKAEGAPSVGRPPKTPDTADLERQLSTALGL
ncbi:MAG: ParB/RepB/Spo0J family partition protein, partial [Pseudomonadota bacterium]